jgi:hypothetical protein
MCCLNSFIIPYTNICPTKAVNESNSKSQLNIGCYMQKVNIEKNWLVRTKCTNEQMAHHLFSVISI